MLCIYTLDKTRQANFGLIKLWFIKSLVLTPVLLFSCILPTPAFAYTNNMSASVVLGQTSFTNGTANSGGVSASTLNGPRGVKVCDGKLVVADNANNRVLIWNSIPVSTAKAADVVLGQADFTSVASNRGGSVGANTISGGWGIECRNGKLFVADNGNFRVLIWNSFPTQNGQPADVVVGQTSMTANSSHNGNDLDKFEAPVGVATDGTRLAVLDSTNQRILIWNAIPNTNGVSANVVLGTNGGHACTSSTLSTSSQNILIDSGKLFWAGTFSLHANRVLIWNTIPATNNQAADVVIGQPNFTTCTANTGTATGLSSPFDIAADPRGRLLIADRGSQRILIFNSVPSTNGASADLVIGQQSFSGISINQGQSAPGANTLSGARGVAATTDKIIVSDGDNNRILIFNNDTNSPSLSLNNNAEGRDGGVIRLKGAATIPSTSSYTISSVHHSVNGGGFTGATATDGSFNSSSEDFYLDFDPKSNQPRDTSNNLIEGYTVRVKSTSSNLDVTDRLFYFSPFDLNTPMDNTSVTTAYPSFAFSVNGQRTNLRDNLSKYQVKARIGGSDSTANWETVVDDIPIDFSTVQTSDSNLQKNTYLNQDPNNSDGVYETAKFTAIYSVDSSHVQVTSKTFPLSGTYQWKIVAVDKSGHNQETGARNLLGNATSMAITSNFPLAVLNISGLGNPNINSYNPGGIKSTYYTTSSNPIFYGIAWMNSKVTLKLTDQSCKTDCIRTYSSIASAGSRFGINIPKGDLKYGKKYTTNLSVVLGNKYNELPQFTLSIGSDASPRVASLAAEEKKEFSPSPSLVGPPMPTPMPTSIPQHQESKKRCVWFICF